MHEGIVSKSLVYFTNTVPSGSASNCPEPLKLKKILDMVSDCFTFAQNSSSQVCAKSFQWTEEIQMIIIMMLLLNVIWKTEILVGFDLLHAFVDWFWRMCLYLIRIISQYLAYCYCLWMSWKLCYLVFVFSLP